MNIQKITKTKVNTSHIMSKTKTRDLIHSLVINNINDVFNFRFEDQRKAITINLIKQATEIAEKGKQELNEQFTVMLNNVLYTKVKEYNAYESVTDIPDNTVPEVAAFNSIESFIAGLNVFVKNLIKTNPVKKYIAGCNQLTLVLLDKTVVTVDYLDGKKHHYFIKDANKQVLFNVTH